MKRFLFHPVILLVLFVIIFFYKQVFFGEVFYCCDNIAINIPSKVFLIEELKQGKFPLWNPYILSGTPFLADINLGLLYPLNVLYVMFPPFQALTAGVMLDFIIAVIGMYILARSLRLTQFASTVTSVIFTLSGTMIVYINNVPMLQVAALLPWVAWTWMAYFYKPTKKYYCILVGLLTFQIIAGHPQFTYYTWLWGIAYVLFVSPISIKQKFISFASVCGLVFLLSAIQIIPFIELAGNSTRVGRDFTYASFDSLHPFNIVRFILPNIVGDSSGGTDWIQRGSVYGYVGILPLILLLWIPFKKVHARFFLGVAAISFLLALGKYTPIFFVAYTFIPGIGSFRSPQHFLFLYTISVAILSGFSIDALETETKKNAFFRLIVPGALIFVIGGIFWPVIGQQFLGIIPKFQRLPTEARDTITGFITTNLFISGALLCIIVFIRRIFTSHKNFLQLAMLFAIFFELFLFNRHNLFSIPVHQVEKWFQSNREIIQRMKEPDDQTYRFFVSPNLYANPVKKQFGVPYVDKETAWQVEIIRTNIHMMYHVSSIDGYASLISRPYKELFQKGVGDPTGIDFGDMTGISWDTLGVRYVLARHDEIVFKNNPAFVPIWSDENKILYRNPNALPVLYPTSIPKSVTIGFWLTVFGFVVYAVLIMSLKERKR